MKWSAFKALVKVISEDEAMDLIDSARLAELDKRVRAYAGQLDVEAGEAFDRITGGTMPHIKNQRFSEYVHKQLIAENLRKLVVDLDTRKNPVEDA